MSVDRFPRPRIGFLGTGWIGRSRMEAIVGTGAVETVALCDPDDSCAQAALVLVPEARRVGSFRDLLAMGLDGIVIATPSAAHAAQAIAALDQGCAVFCQKPLATSAQDAAAVVGAARRAGRLLAVDFSYRRTAALSALRGLLREGALGTVFALDLVFHNAYGPDKPWFYDAALSGGGCMMDLGCHLIDAALWLMDHPPVERIEASLIAGGRPATDGAVEDHALATLHFPAGVTARIACSWNLHAGADAEIALRVYGTQGGAMLRNVGGSFLEFELVRARGTHAERIVSPPDAWSGRLAADWARRLAVEPAFDPACEGLVAVSEAIDRIYRVGRARSSQRPSGPRDHATA